MSRKIDYNKNKEFYISELQRFYRENGRSPKTIDLTNNKDYPPALHIEKAFKGWTNALLAANLKLNYNLGVTKEEMINKVKEFYEIHNRIPNKKELDYSDVVIRNYFNNYCDLIDYCGYKVENGVSKGYTKEFLLEKLQQIINTTGKIPTRKYIMDNKLDPGVHIYDKIFGGLTPALECLGYINKVIPKEIRIKQSIEGLITLAEKLNKCPTIVEYEQLDGVLKRRNLEKHLNLKWNDICKKYLNKYELNIEVKTKEQLMEELIGLKNKLGRSPKSKEVNAKLYNKAFNMTFNELILSLGWELSGHVSLQKTDDELLDDFYKLYKKLNRLPYTHEIDNPEHMASWATYKYRFGNMVKICELLNIDYELEYKPPTVGVTCFDLLNRRCKSLTEKQISDFLINNNIAHQKEVLYGNVLDNRKDKRRLDWVVYDLNNNPYYVEYFGLWDSSRKDTNYKNKAKKKIKDLYKAGLVNNCIFIFPKELNNISLNKIFDKIVKRNIA